MNTGRINIQLTPARDPPADRAADRAAAPRTARPLPGFRAFVNVPAALQIGGFQGNSNYNLMVESLNYDEL